MEPAAFIDALGGTFAVAELLGIKPPSVSGWKESGRIPDDKLMRLAPIAEARGVATRRDLFPRDAHKIWPDLAPHEPIGEAPASNSEVAGA